MANRLYSQKAIDINYKNPIQKTSSRINKHLLFIRNKVEHISLLEAYAGVVCGV